MMISLPELILELRELWTQISQYLDRDSLCHCSPPLWARQSVTPHPPPTTFFQILNLSFFQDFPEIHLTLTEKAPGRFELCNHFITVYTIQMHFLPLKMRVRSRLLDIYTDARQKSSIVFFSEGKISLCNIPLQKCLCWKHIWLILAAVCAECGERWIFPPVPPPTWLTQMEYPPPMCQFHGVNRCSG